MCPRLRSLRPLRSHDPAFGPYVETDQPRDRPCMRLAGKPPRTQARNARLAVQCDTAHEQFGDYCARSSTFALWVPGNESSNRCDCWRQSPLLGSRSGCQFQLWPSRHQQRRQKRLLRRNLYCVLRLRRSNPLSSSVPTGATRVSASIYSRTYQTKSASISSTWMWARWERNSTQCARDEPILQLAQSVLPRLVRRQ